MAGGTSSSACPRGISLAEVYDAALDEWKALPDMSTIRCKCVGVTWQGKIHVVGGFAEKGVHGFHGTRWSGVLLRCTTRSMTGGIS